MNWERPLDDWRFLYSGDEKIWFMVGDNPIITHGYSDHDPVKCLFEFIFPVSGKILLLNSNVRKREVFPPEFTVQYNVAIIERAQRFVACQRRDLLEALIKYYKFHVQHERTDEIIIELFEMLTETKKEKEST